MDDIISLDTLRARGLDHPEIRRLVRSGELERVRRGVFMRPSSPCTVEERHRRLVRATSRFLGEGAVISHFSAATLHRLPVWPDAIGRVHLTHPRSYGGKRRDSVHVHLGRLPPDDVVRIDGIPVTSLARTVLDLGRSATLAQTVAAGDRALLLGLTGHELAEGLSRMERWPGTRQARQAVAMLDPRSESAGESASRVELINQNLPHPELQLEIVDGRGDFVARSDFGWAEQRTVGEFDGKIKYGRLLRPGETVEDVVWDEKLREDAIRDAGWQVVRWTWADLRRPEVIRDRILRAFDRSAAGRPRSGW
ncbi:type IV toxin-antitoxin system AbiEi family antitoxin domain-containing protein [Microlunatus ginsengisoli]